MLKRILVALGFLFWLSCSARAHFLIVIPEEGNGYALRGRELDLMVTYGHPFEGILYDLKNPSGFLILPDGKKAPLPFSRTLVKDHASGKKRFAYRIRFLPTQRGDHLFCVEAKPYLNEEEGEVWKDYMKTLIHVQVEKGWDNSCGFPLELVPLNRPYGMMKGSVFVGRLLFNGKPLGGVTLEVEKFNGFYVPEEGLPKDAFGRINEPLMTYTVMTNDDGYFVVTLPEPGWWAINASVKSGNTSYAGKSFPLVVRSGVWVYVFDGFTVKPTGLDIKLEEK